MRQQRYHHSSQVNQLFSLSGDVHRGASQSEPWITLILPHCLPADSLPPRVTAIESFCDNIVRTTSSVQV